MMVPMRSLGKTEQERESMRREKDPSGGINFSRKEASFLPLERKDG